MKESTEAGLLFHLIVQHNDQQTLRNSQGSCVSLSVHNIAARETRRKNILKVSNGILEVA